MLRPTVNVGGGGGRGKKNAEPFNDADGWLGSLGIE